MAFDALVRFELGGKKKYGNLIATTERGFEISELEGSLTEGFAASGKDVIIITKV